MEPSSKKQQTNNPIDRIETTIIDLLFQHFNGREILQLTEISPGWNAQIGRSEKCLQKIEFKVEKSVPHIIETLRRTYHNLLVKNIKFTASHAKAPIESFLKFLSKQSTLRSLTFRNFSSFNSLEDFNIEFKLSKLKFLKFITVDDDLCDFFLDLTNDGLESLTIANTFIEHSIINKFTNLKVLCLVNIQFDDVLLPELGEMLNINELTLLKLSNIQIFTILAKCPNVKVLKLEKLTKTIIEGILKAKLAHLEELFYSFSFKLLNFRKFQQILTNKHENFESSDPLLKLPQNCCDLIFQHFRGIELLKLSKTSILWFNTIAESQICMSKLQQNVNKERQNMLLVNETLRTYQHVQIVNLESVAYFGLNCEAITTFKIFLRRSFYTNIETHEFCHDFLNRIVNLREISITYESFDHARRDEQFQGKIIEFERLLSFVSQQKNLQSLELNAFKFSEVLCFLRRPSFIKLTINKLDFEEVFHDILAKNETVLEINLSESKIDDKTLKQLTAICFRTKTLKIERLTMKNLKIILEMKSLQKVFYFKIDKKCLKFTNESKMEFTQLKPKTCIDPFVRISENLHELMVQHLKSYIGDPRDSEGKPRFALRLLEVSRTWNNFILNSEKFFGKFTYVINSDELPESSSFEKRENICFLVNSRQKPEKLPKIRHFISFFNESIVVLIILDANLFDGDTILNPSGCPKLESLNIFVQYQNRLNCNVVTSNFQTTNLTSLNLMNLRLKSVDAEAFAQFLTLNEKLTKVILQDVEGLHEIFNYDISSQVRFKLRKLVFPIYENVRILNTVIEENFINFLKTQASSLQTLLLTRVTGRTIAMIFQSFRKLEMLQFLNVVGFNETFSMQMKPLESLKSLVVPFMYNLDYVKPFLECSPRLETFSLGGLSDEILQFCCVNMKCLKVIFYHYSSVEKIKLKKHDEHRGVRISFSGILSGSENRQNAWVEKKLNEN